MTVTNTRAQSADLLHCSKELIAASEELVTTSQYILSEIIFSRLESAACLERTRRLLQLSQHLADLPVTSP